MESPINKPPIISIAKSCSLLGLFILAYMSALLLTPEFQDAAPAPDFEKTIPREFGEWRAITDPFMQVSLTANKNDQIGLLYDQVLMRTYVNKEGERIMLAIAYAREQRQDVKIHRPEVCYIAQGFQMISHKDKVFNLQEFKKPVMAHQLLMQNDSRYEAISYWIRIGNEYPSNGFDARLKILKDGLNGRISDGVLVRASISLSNQSNAWLAYDKQEIFMSDLVNAVNKSTKNILVTN